MLLNYLKLSLRLLARNPFFTGINVVGLAIGFASFYALWEYSTSELKSDQYHRDSERIARIGVNWRWTEDGGKTWGLLTIGLGRTSFFPKMKDDFPEMESFLRILNQNFFTTDMVNHRDKIILSTDEQTNQPRIFTEDKVAYADANLFTFFSIPLVYGQADKVLGQANQVVLSQSTAVKYFGKIDPSGQLLKLNDTITLSVSGVYEDLPHYSHLNFELVISNVGLENKWNADQWAPVCYVKLRDGDFKSFETKLNERSNDYWAESLKRYPMAKVDMFIQPLAEIPFSQNFVNENFSAKSKEFLLTLAFIALSVLVMAWVNYINLSVTRTARRLKEVATRKVSGAGALDMARQFVTEALVTNIFALGLAFTLIQIIREPVSVLFNIHIASFASLSLGSISIFVTIIILGVLVSGLYPAIISMAYQPRALFSMSSSAQGNRLIPSLLTISQLSAAMIFILLGFTVCLQLNHILNLNTGINKNNVVIIEAPVVKPENYTSILSAFKKQITNNSDVIGATTSHNLLVDQAGGPPFHSKRLGADIFFGMDRNIVDEDYLELYGLQLLAGRNFTRDNQSNGIIISRVAANRLGFNSPDEAVGATIHVIETVGSNSWKEAEVMGVIEDFRLYPFLNMSQTSTETQGRGIVLTYEGQSFGDPVQVPEKISLRTQSQNFEETIHSIQTLFAEQFPGNVFNWYFLSDHVNRAYANEKAARNQIVLFTVLALLIACLGLLGMISNKVVEKTKEIGIRKVLGAQLNQIVQLLLNNTLKQVTIATIVGIPMAYLLIQQYLEKFSERIVLQWWHFTLPVVILIAIMFATIASVLWKAAKSNPVEALKYE